MDFPTVPITAPAALPPDAAKTLGVDGPITPVGVGGTGLLLRLPTAAHVLAANPDFKTLATWHPHAVLITAPGDSEHASADFVSRFFAPCAGINEDPVTGSAHCTLAPYWSKELGRINFTALQLSKRRGLLRVTLTGNRVELQGQARITARGTIESPPA